MMPDLRNHIPNITTQNRESQETMDIRQRDEQIWRLRKEGKTYSQIAKQFDLSKHRIRQIYFKKQERMEKAAEWPALKRELSARVQHVLVKVFGSEEILNQRAVEKDGRTLCLSCAGESYWSAIE